MLSPLRQTRNYTQRDSFTPPAPRFRWGFGVVRKDGAVFKLSRHWPLVIALATLVLIFSSNASTLAQATPVITDIRVTELTPTYADIAWTTDLPADSAVRWGTNAGALTESVNSAVQTTNHKLRLEPLQESTAYFYQVSSGGATEPAAPASFATPAAGPDTTPPGLFDLTINANCCTATFSWSVTEAASYALQIQGVGSVNSGGAFQTSWRVDWTNPPFNALTTYSYTIELADQAGNSRTYGPLAFRTGKDLSDFVFQTGACPDGTALGTCNNQGQYCGPGGLVTDCALCGYECQIGQTCRNGGACTEDPATGQSVYQCNPATCYDPSGNFVQPAGVGCYESYPRCNSNTVIKVQKDRACNKWMTCRTQTEVANPSTKQKESLCYDLTACASVGADGQCAKPLYGKFCEEDPLRFCSTASDCESGKCRPVSGRWCDPPYEDPAGSGLYAYEPCNAPVGTSCKISGTCQDFGPANVTYKTPEDVSKIRYLSGSVGAGLDWAGQSYTIEGMYPWYYMPQAGSSVPLGNENFEQRETTTETGADGTQKTATAYTTRPWKAIGGAGSDNTEPTVSVISEDASNQNNPNHVLKIDPTDSVDAEGNSNSGAQAPQQPFSTLDSAEYFVAFRIKSSVPEGQKVRVRFFSPSGFTSIVIDNIELNTGWQTIVSKPIPGLQGGSAFLQFIRLSGSTDPFYLDDVSMNVVLGARTGGDGLEYIQRSCRLFPREDSLLCQYADDSGLKYKGFYGYCLEKDPKFTDRCISWWPVDVIGGETDVFGTFGSETPAGYQDRAPLYYCLEAKGVSGGDRIDYTHPSGFQSTYQVIGNAKLGRSSIERIPQGLNCGSLYSFGSGPHILWCDEANNSEYPVQTEDQYNQNEISKIVIKQTQKSHDDWTFSPLVLNADNGWKATHSDRSNSVTVTANFSGGNKLESYTINGNDGSSGEGGFEAQVEFYLRESCTKIAKVVNEDGSNKAWTSRVSTGSGYITYPTNYRFTTDQAPYGGTVTAAGDPETWTDKLYVEAARTNESFSSPYQIRAGAPAACRGDCSSRICIGGGIKDGQLCKTAEDCRDSNGEQGVCSGVGTCSKTAQACYSSSQCPESETCIGGAASNNSQGTCSVSGDPCQTSASCPSGEICNHTPINQSYSFGLNDSYQCAESGFWCCKNSPFCPGPPTADDFGDNYCAQLITGDTCELNTPSISSTGRGVKTVQSLFAKSYGFWTWNPKTGSYKSQPTDPDGQANYIIGTTGWTPPTEICKVCDQGGEACTDTSHCSVSGATCIEKKGTRGSRNLDWGNDDYCGNKPRTFNISVNDKAVASVPDGGWVAFKFNTSADPEQLPLQNILINWTGDAVGTNERFQDQQTIYFPYAPKSSQESPHVVSHRYFCDPNNQPPPCGAGSFPCWDNDTNSCVYQPRVIVEDNWSWCSSSETPAVPCVKSAGTFPASVSETGEPITVLVTPVGQ